MFLQDRFNNSMEKEKEAACPISQSPQYNDLIPITLDATTDSLSLFHTRLWVPRVGMVFYSALSPQCAERHPACAVLKTICGVNERVVSDALA